MRGAERLAHVRPRPRRGERRCFFYLHLARLQRSVGSAQNTPGAIALLAPGPPAAIKIFQAFLPYRTVYPGTHARDVSEIPNTPTRNTPTRKTNRISYTMKFLRLNDSHVHALSARSINRASSGVLGVGQRGVGRCAALSVESHAIAGWLLSRGELADRQQTGRGVLPSAT